MITVAKGQGGPQGLDGGASLSFIESMQPGALDAPATARLDAGRRIDAALALLATRIAEYRAACVAETGPANVEERIALNARNFVRRAGLAAVFGLTP